MFMLRSNSVVSMWFIRQGQFQNKYGTIRRFLFQIQLSTMEASQFLGNRKAKAGMIFAAPGPRPLGKSDRIHDPTTPLECRGRYL